MAIAGTDAYGAFLDTGTNTTPAPRASTEQEVHGALEIDSGAKFTPVAGATTRIPHRSANSPR